MADSRIKGQEVIARFTRGSAVIAEFTTFKSMDFRYQFALIEQGYLGETSERKDEIFKGVGGTIEADMADEQYLVFVDMVRQRAQRKISLADARVNFRATFNFPNGQRPALLIRDMAFGETGINSPSRDAYVPLSLPYASSDPRLIRS